MKKLLLFCCAFLYGQAAFASCGTSSSPNHLAGVAATMVPGEWCLLNQFGDGSGYQWTNFLDGFPEGNTAGPVAGIFAYAQKAAYDPTGNTVYYNGSPHFEGSPVCNSAGQPACPQTQIKYDVATNHWTKIGPTAPLGSINVGYHTLDTNTIDVADRLFFVNGFLGSSIDRFDITTGLFTSSTMAQSSLGSADPSLEYFPDLPRPGGGAGQLVFVKLQYYDLYNPATNTWSGPQGPLTNIGGRNAIARYSTSCQCIVIMGGAFSTLNLDTATGVYQLSKTGVLTQKHFGPLTIYQNYAIEMADPVSGHIIVINNVRRGPYITSGGGYATQVEMWDYDPINDVWEGMDPSTIPDPSTWWPNIAMFGEVTPQQVVAAPINTYGVIMLCSAANTDALSKCYLYKHKVPTAQNFAQKAASPGVIGAWNFDSVSSIRTVPSTTVGMRYYWGTPGSEQYTVCDPVMRPLFGTPYGVRSMMRLAGETNAEIYAEPPAVAMLPQTCEYPQIVSDHPHSGTGNLRLTVPAMADAGNGGDFVSTFQGMDVNQPATAYGGAHTLGQEVWQQYYHRSHNVISNDFTVVFNDSRAKIEIFGATPPSLDFLGSDNTMASVISYELGWDSASGPTRNGLFWGYVRDANGNVASNERGLYPGTTFIETGSHCPYDGSTPQNYTYPPCIRLQDDVWQQITRRMKLNAVNTHYQISGTTLSINSANFGTPFADGVINGNFVGRYVFIKGKGYYRITAKIDNDHVTLNAAPGNTPSGQNEIVYISAYPNGTLQEWIDGVLMLDNHDIQYAWDIPNNGWGEFMFHNHMTNRSQPGGGPFVPTSLPGGAGYNEYDDMIISTLPISMTTANPCTTPDHLLFNSQPSNANVGGSIGSVTVGIYDAAGAFCGSATNTITFSNHSGTCTGMTLSSATGLSGAAVSGTFNRSDMVENAAGTCQLEANASGLTGATSNPFTISTTLPTLTSILPAVIYTP